MSSGSGKTEANDIMFVLWARNAQLSDGETEVLSDHTG